MADSSTDLIIMAGMPPGGLGTGRAIEYLIEKGVKVHYKRDFVPKLPLHLRGRPFVIRLARLIANMMFLPSEHYLRWVTDRGVMILHPQSLGLRTTINFIKSRSVVTYLYLLDSSFFCVRSYNYIPGEAAPCLRCLGGAFDARVRNGCQAFPRPDPDAASYATELLHLAKAGKVRFCAQSHSQAALAERHFGVPVPVVGLMTSDIDTIETADLVAAQAMTPEWDVVFHGHWLDAKGARWLLETASRLPPHRRVLFPCARPSMPSSIGENIVFKPMTWGAGLRKAVMKARIVMTPSLWSAPIEGSVVKSIFLARAVAVARNDTAFSSEIPDDVVLKVPVDHAAAARALERALLEDWRPESEKRAAWINGFKAENAAFVARLCSVVRNPPAHGSPDGV